MMSSKMPAALKLHKASGQWRAWLNGRHRYFGRDPEEAVKLYGLFLAQDPGGNVTLAQMISEVQAWANDRYPPSGRWGGTAKLFRYAFRWLDARVQVQSRGLITTVFLPSMPVESFTVMHLAAARARMITASRKRGYINSTIGRIQQAFAVARERGLVSREVVQDVQTLAPLPAGHRAVSSSEPVGPVHQASVNSILPYLSDPMRAVVELLSLTGMRCSEALAMRVRMIQTGPELWQYDLGIQHKGGRGGRSKLVYLGPRAQAVILARLEQARARHDLNAPLFPAISPRATSDTIAVSSVRDAIELACRKAGVEQFTTHQLRHGKATRVAESEALKAVRAVLGHSSESSSRVYTELDAIAREHARLSG